MNRSVDPLTDIFDKITDTVVQYRYHIAVAAAGIAIAAGAGVWYRYASNQSAMRASKELLHVVRLFEEQVRSEQETSPEQWEALAKTLADSFEKNSSARISAAFLMYQADALLRADKMSEAITVMKKAVYSSSIASQVRAYYELKLALVLIDTNNQDQVAEGVALLEKLAAQVKGAAQEHALFHLGMHHWVNKQYAQAKHYWQQYMVNYGTDASCADLTEKVKSMLELVTI